MKNLVKDASMGPLREALGRGINISTLQKEDMRPVTLEVLENSLSLSKVWRSLIFIFSRIFRVRCRR